MSLRFILLLSFMLGFIASLRSQVMVKVNNLWSNLIEESLPGTYSFHIQKIQGDTTIDNKEFKKLFGTTNILKPTGIMRPPSEKQSQDKFISKKPILSPNTCFMTSISQ